MNKATGQPLKDVTGHDVLVTKSFTPVTTKGSIGLDFTLDATHLANKDVVVFELLKETVADKEVAAHRDINDKGQTVHFEDKPKLPSTDGYPRRPLPMTGETQIAIGFFLSLIVSLVGILTRIKHKANKKHLLSAHENSGLLTPCLRAGTCIMHNKKRPPNGRPNCV